MTDALLNVLHLCDPMLPIGGFSHSYGLETYTQKDIVTSIEDMENFIIEMLTQNMATNDAAFISLVYEACQNNDWNKVVALDELCHASKLPEEIRKASQKLGIRLAKIFSPLMTSNYSKNIDTDIKNKNIQGHYCILFAVYAHLMNIDKKAAIKGYLYNAVIGFITNAVKLIPLSQNDGQKLIFKLLPLIDKLTLNAVTPNLDKLGMSTTAFDIRAMEHEKLYSRLYMS